MDNEYYEQEEPLSRNVLSLLPDEVSVYGLNRPVTASPLVYSANMIDDANPMNLEMRLAFRIGDSHSELYSVLSETNCDN